MKQQVFTSPHSKHDIRLMNRANNGRKQGEKRKKGRSHGESDRWLGWGWAGLGLVPTRERLPAGKGSLFVGRRSGLGGLAGNSGGAVPPETTNTVYLHLFQTKNFF